MSQIFSNKNESKIKSFIANNKTTIKVVLYITLAVSVAFVFLAPPLLSLLTALYLVIFASLLTIYDRIQSICDNI